MVVDLQRDISLSSAIARLRGHDLNVRHVISIGAGSGGDSDFIHRNLCPAGTMLLIEAQQSHAAALERLCAANPAYRFEICAASGADGEVSFAASAPTGGAIVAASDATVTVPSRSIDSLVTEHRADGPFMLKFDTHGVELDILAGAERVLGDTALIMMEVYNFKLNFVGNRNLRFYEMCGWLEEKGFRCIDLCEPLFRPNDKALWQMHMFFIPTSHRVWRSNSYNAPAPSRSV